MNKIKIVNDEIKIINLNNSIEYEIKDNLIKTLKIEILKDTNLFIDYEFSILAKLEIIIELKDNVNLKLYEIKNGNNIQSPLCYYKINLNEKKSKINYIFKTISTSKEKYDITVYHNQSNTESYIKNNGVALKDGKIKFNVSSFVPNGNKECQVDQVNRIINLTKNKCEIDPNLYIDEYDVNASHSALIGKFSDEEMFYLESRGINKTDALKLLIKGFILSNIEIEELKNQINEKIEKYWR